MQNARFPNISSYIQPCRHKVSILPQFLITLAPLVSGIRGIAGGPLAPLPSAAPPLHLSQTLSGLGGLCLSTLPLTQHYPTNSAPLSSLLQQPTQHPPTPALLLSRPPAVPLLLGLHLAALALHAGHLLLLHQHLLRSGPSVGGQAGWVGGCTSARGRGGEP
jgi:hypothetical protein